MRGLHPATRHTMELLLQVIGEITVGTAVVRRVNGTTADLVIETHDDRLVDVRMPANDAEHVAEVINTHRYS